LSGGQAETNMRKRDRSGMMKSSLGEIVKRDGRVVPFDQGRITRAIYKASLSVGVDDKGMAEKISDKVVESLEEKFKGKAIPNVEAVQDTVEQTLLRQGYADIAKSYILYREKRAEIREAKKLIGVEDELKLGLNALRVLKRRYLLKDNEGLIIETPAQLFRRVAKVMAKVDLTYDKKADVHRVEDEFYQLMTSFKFLPNSPTLMNAGTAIGQLSACFVIPVADSLRGIFDAVKYMALIQQSGGGTGFSFSRLRPKGDVVKTTKGVASGPVSFMRVFDAATDVIKQGGRRRGANMGVLRVDHPDIEDFITAKSKEGFLANFNLSVAVTDNFMDVLEHGEEFELVDPRTRKVARRLPAKSIFDLIVHMAWRTGDPGLIFIDEVNRLNPTPELGDIESTNPCGEQILLPFESCNLGSINLAEMVADGKINWEELRLTTRSAVHFLDNVIDANKFPLVQIERITKGNRKIGLGVMGFAEILIELGIPYDSEEALDLGEKVIKFISEEARNESVEIAERRSSFPNFKGSVWEKKGYNAVRNATQSTIAPTGTISIIAGCSSGIEPLFAISFVRSVMEGTQLIEINPLFEKIARREGFYSKDLMLEIARTGSIQGLKEVPAKFRRIFLTALDIDPEWHIRMQAAFQKYVDNAIAKTVNLPPDAGLDEVRKVFLLAHKLKCKGVTIYRYGSKKEQVLYLGSRFAVRSGEDHVLAESEYAGGCPADACPF